MDVLLHRRLPVGACHARTSFSPKTNTVSRLGDTYQSSMWPTLRVSSTPTAERRPSLRARPREQTPMVLAMTGAPLAAPAAAACQGPKRARDYSAAFRPASGTRRLVNRSYRIGSHVWASRKAAGGRGQRIASRNGARTPWRSLWVPARTPTAPAPCRGPPRRPTRPVGTLSFDSRATRLASRNRRRTVSAPAHNTRSAPRAAHTRKSRVRRAPCCRPCLRPTSLGCDPTPISRNLPLLACSARTRLR